MEFSKESIQQGQANQSASVETPETFSTIEGASQPRGCLLYTSPSPRDGLLSRMPSSA